jgi:hypothetical protein
MVVALRLPVTVKPIDSVCVDVPQLGRNDRHVQNQCDSQTVEAVIQQWLSVLANADEYSTFFTKCTGI